MGCGIVWWEMIRCVVAVAVLLAQSEAAAVISRLYNGEAAVATSRIEAKLTEDDMLFANENQGDNLRQGSAASDAIQRNDFLWSKATVPYVITSEIEQHAERVRAINLAIELFRNYTCIRWQPRVDQADYVEFIDAGIARCFSWVGRVGGGQELSVGEGCESKVGVVIHEMMHALGFIHEHTRSDRNDFVHINWPAIEARKVNNFKVLGIEHMSENKSYDYASVMHYHSYAFSVNGSRTITTNDERAQAVIGQRDGFSACDLAKLNHLYGCSVANAPPCIEHDEPTTTAPPLQCVDSYVGCVAAAKNPQLCNRFPGIYRRFCDRTCNWCEGPLCMDSPARKTLCRQYASSALQLCRSHFVIRAMCPQSCGLC